MLIHVAFLTMVEPDSTLPGIHKNVDSNVRNVAMLSQKIYDKIRTEPKKQKKFVYMCQHRLGTIRGLYWIRVTGYLQIKDVFIISVKDTLHLK